MVKLRRVARQCAVLQQPFGVLRVGVRQCGIGAFGLRETHRPEMGRVGNPPPQFAVNEVADAAGCQPCRHEWGNEIHHLPKAQAAFLGKQEHGEQHAQKAAVERHAAFPHFEHIQWVGQIGAEIVKQDIADAATQNHAQHAPSQQVVQHFVGERGAAFFDAAAAEPDKQDEADNIAQGIPADGNGAEGKYVGVELWMNQHNGSRKIVNQSLEGGIIAYSQSAGCFSATERRISCTIRAFFTTRPPVGSEFYGRPSQLVHHTSRTTHLKPA